MKHQKTLGQSTYESRAKNIWGPWAKAPQIIRDAYETDAKATVRALVRRLKAKTAKKAFAANRRAIIALEKSFG